MNESIGCDKYRIHFGYDSREKIITYDQVIHAMNAEEEDFQEYWTYQPIKGHRKGHFHPRSWKVMARMEKRYESS